MATDVILSRFSPEAFRDPKDFKKLGRQGRGGRMPVGAAKFLANL